MAKKPPAKQTKKMSKRAPAAPRAQRSASATSSGKAAQSKYQQSGAPWWKQFLPG